MTSYLFILLLQFAGIDAYKFLIVSPLFGHSHTNFMGKIADTLTDAGHDVTVFMPVLDTTLMDRTGVKSTKKVIIHPVDPRVDEIMINFRKNMLTDIWKQGTDALALLQMARNTSKFSSYACENALNDNSLWTQMKAEKFDVGIAEPFGICGLAMFQILNIPYISALSTVQIDAVSHAMGEPLAPSFVPAMTSGKGVKMGVLDRVENGISTGLGMYFFTRTFQAEIEVLRRKFGNDFPNYDEILAKASYVFTNSNPLLNYPRPIIQKTVEIGGITVPTFKTTKKDLGEWDAVLNQRKHSVFLSFGSIAKSKDMPDTYKKNLLAVFESLPNVTFIWKYETPTKMADHLKNVHISSWLPQNALLGDDRLSAFLTHGGLGSTLEVAHFGKPAICVPLFSEQPRNAAMLAQHGGAIVLEKHDLNNRDTIRNAINTILLDKSYAANAEKLSEMLLNSPTSPKETMLKHAEFVARFGYLPQLDPYGRHLSLFQYYYLDVVLLVAVILYTAYRIVAVIICKCASICRSKQKFE